MDNLAVQVQYALKAIPPDPARQMRNRVGGGSLSYLAYAMYVDPARTRYWGNGETDGTFAFTGELNLDDRNRIGSLAHLVYGQIPSGQGAVLPDQWLGLVGLRLEYTALCLGNGNLRGGNRPGIRGGR